MRRANSLDVGDHFDLVWPLNCGMEKIPRQPFSSCMEEHWQPGISGFSLGVCDYFVGTETCAAACNLKNSVQCLDQSGSWIWRLLSRNGVGRLFKSPAQSTTGNFFRNVCGLVRKLIRLSFSGYRWTVGNHDGLGLWTGLFWPLTCSWRKQTWPWLKAIYGDHSNRHEPGWPIKPQPGLEGHDHFLLKIYQWLVSAAARYFFPETFVD